MFKVESFVPGRVESIGSTEFSSLETAFNFIQGEYKSPGYRSKWNVYREDPGSSTGFTLLLIILSINEESHETKIAKESSGI